MVRYLLDTSVIIEALRVHKLKAIQFITIKYGSKTFISSITVAELYSGASAQDKEVDAYLKLLIGSQNIVELSQETMITAGQLRYFNKLSIADAIIAACAIENGLVLVTHNIKDFEGIKGFKVIRPKR